jgi:large subunit ribosomal protein L35
MPKLKTHKGTAKRVKLTSTGKLLRLRANGTHFQEKKSGARKRVISTNAGIRGSIRKNLKRVLGV